MSSNPKHALKLPVSVVIIAKNEEKNLPTCLKSVMWANEIVAVINDCNDKTEAILKEHGAKVYQNEWKGYIQQKNAALAYAQEKWILSLDADEEVPPALEAEIRRLLQNESSDFEAVSFRRKTYLLGRWIKHGDWYPDRVVRLWKNGKAKFVGHYQHEELVVEGSIKKVSANILHYSYPTLYTFLKKTESFTRGFEIESEGKKFSLFSMLFRANWKFIRAYFLRLGFLDGFPGFVVAIQQSYGTFFKYSILYEKEVSTKLIVLDSEDLKADGV